VQDDSITEDMHIIKNENIFKSISRRIFWQQQIEAASRKDTKGEKGHPFMISIYGTNPVGHELRSSSGCVSLPSQQLHYVLSIKTLKTGTHRKQLHQ
jgi:hypothetical protein